MTAKRVRPIFLHVAGGKRVKVVALRLRAIAAIHGITTVIVPPKPDDLEDDDADHIYLGPVKSNKRLRPTLALLDQIGFCMLHMEFARKA